MYCICNIVHIVHYINPTPTLLAVEGSQHHCFTQKNDSLLTDDTSLCCESCAFRKLDLLFFGVTILGQCTCRLILCSMPEQSTSKLTIILWGNVLHRSYFRLSSSIALAAFIWISNVCSTMQSECMLEFYCSIDLILI
jgi:hypothetical protein